MGSAFPAPAFLSPRSAPVPPVVTGFSTQGLLRPLIQLKFCKQSYRPPRAGARGTHTAAATPRPQERRHAHASSSEKAPFFLLAPRFGTNSALSWARGVSGSVGRDGGLCGDPQNPGASRILPPTALTAAGRETGSPRLLGQTSASPAPPRWGPALHPPRAQTPAGHSPGKP